LHFQNQPNDVDFVRQSMDCLPGEVKEFIKMMQATTIQTFIDTLAATEFGVKYSKKLVSSCGSPDSNLGIA
jgi:hypothetical protein